jgi:hypothetical protein
MQRPPLPQSEAAAASRSKIALAVLCGLSLLSSIARADSVPVQATFKIPGRFLHLKSPYEQVSGVATAQRTGVSGSVLSFAGPIFDDYIPLADSDFTASAMLPTHTTVGLEVKGGTGVLELGDGATSFACPLNGRERACVSADKIGGAMPIRARIRLGTLTLLGGMASFIPFSLSHRLGTAAVSSFKATNTSPPFSTVVERFSRPPWTGGVAKALSVGPAGQKMITKTGSLMGTIMTNAFQINLVVPSATAVFKTTSGTTNEVTQITTAELRLVPEPAHGLLLGAGAALVAALGVWHRRRSRMATESRIGASG